MSKILCKLGWHKYSRHYEILPLPASDPLQATIFKVCINCGKWWRGRDPETFKRNGIEARPLIQSEISKREQLLLDELEEAVGNAKYGEDQGFNYEQAVDDVYDFINAKRGKK